MTRQRVYKSVNIEFQYDENYCEKVVEENEPDSWIETSLSVSDNDIYGGSRSAVTGFACWTVLQMLRSIEAIRNSERYVIQFDYGPSWLSVDPYGRENVEIAACILHRGAKNPDDRDDAARVVVATKRAWEEAILELAQDFYDMVVDLNPDLHNHEVMTEIRSKVEELKGANDS